MSLKLPREDMAHNLFNFLYSVGMAHCVIAMATADYKESFPKGGQFHVVATENPNFPYDTLSVTKYGAEGTTQITSLDELQLSFWVETKKAFQVLSPDIVMYVLCERTAIMTTSGVYNENELDDTEQKFIDNNYDFGNYHSQIL